MMFGQEEKAPAMRFFVMCDEDGPMLGDGESVLHRCDDVELAFVSGPPVGRGRVVVTSQRLLWLGEQRSFAFSVPSILLHALTSDPDSYPRPCLYCQLDLESDMRGPDDDDNGDDDGAEEGGESAFIASCNTGEVFLAPPADADEAGAAAGAGAEAGAAGALQALFKALSDAALLCPDPDDDETMGAAGDWITADSFAGEEEGGEEGAAQGEGEGEAGLITDQEGLRGLSEAQQKALAHWDTIFVAPGEQPRAHSPA